MKHHLLSQNKKCIYLFFILLSTALFAENQAITSSTYSSFDITFEWSPERALNYESRNLFGVLLPKDWKMADKNDFTITFSNKTPVSGQFAYCQFYSDYLETANQAPDGYYWWGGRSFDKTRYNNTEKFSFSFRIYTDSQVGDFNLKYSVGDDKSNTIQNHFISETFTVTVTQGDKFPAEKERHWELITGSWSTSYYSDLDFDGFFQRYYGWNGGDIGISTLLPDGQSAWTWGDYHSGVVNSERNRLSELGQFPRNALTVQDGTDFSAFRLLTDDKLGQIKPAIVYNDDTGKEINGGTEWYWPMGGNVYYRNGVPELQLVLEHVVTAGGGQWGMKAVSCDVAIFSFPEMQLKSVVKDRYVGDIALANIIFKDDDGVIYMYGEKNYGICASATFVARNTDGDLSGVWEYYDAKNKIWSTDHSWESNASFWNYAIQSNAIFVFKDGGKYYALEQPGCFGRQTYIYDAASPIGPFTNRRQVGELPAEISTGDYICYIPALHQQFSKDGELLYSISKNYQGDNIKSFNASGSGDVYLPYFFRVKKWRDKLSIVDDDITGKGGTLSAEHQETVANLTDKNENTNYAVAAGNGETWVQYVSDKPLFLRRYTITSASDSLEKDPLHWQMLGSADGVAWTVLDERFYATFDERQQTNCYTVPIDRTFTHFRLNILSANGSAGLQIAEWQLFGQYVDFEYTGTGINSVDKSEQMMLFPNPVTNYLNIRNEENQPIEKIIIYDVSGRIIYKNQPHSSNLQINTANWNKGIYIVNIFVFNKNYRRKIIKV